jgi:hypothetical protein
MQRNVHEAAEDGRPNLGKGTDGHRVENAVPYHAEAPRTLGDEHVPVRQERHAPRVVEAVGHHGHAHTAAFCLEVERPASEPRCASSAPPATSAPPGLLLTRNGGAGSPAGEIGYGAEQNESGERDEGEFGTGAHHGNPPRPPTAGIAATRSA